MKKMISHLYKIKWVKEESRYNKRGRKYNGKVVER